MMRLLPGQLKKGMEMRRAHRAVSGRHGVALLTATGLLMIAGCDFAPIYHTPEMAKPLAFKEDQAAPSGNGRIIPAAYVTGPQAAAWHPAQPSDQQPRGKWWLIFHDPALDDLEAKATAANQNLKAAIAQLDQARAVASIARSAYYPLVTFNGQADRNRISTQIANTRPRAIYNDILMSGDVSYEIDLWGRVRNTVKNAEALAVASAGDVASLQLSVQAELASDYFTLQGDDSRIAILQQTVGAYQRAYQLTYHRFQGGAAAESDVDQAATQFQLARTQAADAQLQRSQLEHAIAILIGVPPADLSLPATPLNAAPPSIPVVLPAALLQRRPDIAAAERQVAAENASIGVARAAFFPQLSIGGDFGIEAKSLSHLFTAPAELWSFGPSAAFTIFDAGERNAVTDEARARFNQAVADYRQTVLTAYRDVEDNMAALRQLADETTTQQAGVAAADRQLHQAQLRYTGGIVTYLEVVTAQNTLLQAQLTAVDIATRRMNAGVGLIKAMGGGWDQKNDLDLDKMPTSLAALP